LRRLAAEFDLAASLSNPKSRALALLFKDLSKRKLPNKEAIMKRFMHPPWLLSIVIVAFFSFMKSASAQSVIPISGLIANHEGVAAWQADGTGPEPAGMGHIVPGVGIKAVYYVSSPDYDNIDTSSSAALFSGMEPVTGFPQFTAALQANGFSIAQLKAKVGLLSLGNDIQGQV
jgi:hypothetical protein